MARAVDFECGESGRPLVRSLTEDTSEAAAAAVRWRPPNLRHAPCNARLRGLSIAAAIALVFLVYLIFASFQSTVCTQTCTPLWISIHPFNMCRDRILSNL